MNIIVLWLDDRPRRLDTVSPVYNDAFPIIIIIIIIFRTRIIRYHTPTDVHHRLPAISEDGLGQQGLKKNEKIK